MKLTQLKYFHTVCSLGNNITRASEKLHVTQPCVSNALMELEAELGIKLFQRINKRLQLTTAGEKCLLSADEILNKTEYLLQQMSDISKGKKTLNIGITSMIGSIVLPELFTDFHSDHPDINMEIHELLTDNILRFLDNETLDLAIINSKSLQHSSNTINVTIIPLYNIEYVFCTYHSHPLANEPFVTYDMIANEPLILIKSGDKKDTIAISRFTDEGLEPNILFFVNQIDTLKSFIRNKCASSFLFRDMITSESGIIGISFKEKDISSPAIAFKTNRYIPNAVATFIDFTEKYPFKNK